MTQPMKLTPKQQRRTEKMFKTSIQGMDAVLEHLFEIEDTIEKEIASVNEKIDTSIGLVDTKASQAIVVAQNTAKMRGEDGYTPIKGIDYKDGENYVLTEDDKKEIANSISVPVVEKIIEKTETVVEKPIIQKETTKEIIKELDEDRVKKFVVSLLPDIKSIKKEIEDVRNIATVNALPVTTSFFNGLRAKNLTIDGASASQIGDTVHLSVVSSASGFQIPLTGTVDGSNQTFTWATAPKVIIVDGGRAMQKVSSDGTINWVGTVSTVLTIAPTFDIFSIG